MRARRRQTSRRRRHLEKIARANDLFMGGDIRPKASSVKWPKPHTGTRLRAAWHSCFCRADGIFGWSVAADSPLSHRPLRRAGSRRHIQLGLAVGKTARSSKMPDLFADAPKARRDS